MDTFVPSAAEGASLRFSLRSAFIATAVVCVLMAPVSWFGAYYAISAVLSTGLVIGCTAAYLHAQSGLAVMISVAAAVVGFPLAMGLLVFCFHAILNAVLCALLVILKVRSQVFAMALIGTAALVYGLALWNGAAEVRALGALKDSYPFVSLKDRLAFEKPAARSSSSAEANVPVPLSATVAVNLIDQEQLYEERYFSRSWALQQLHEQSYRHFARAAGFGVMRMPSLRHQLLDRTPSNEIELPLPISAVLRNAPSTELNEMHRQAMFEFASPDRMGYMRSREAVAGFESHRFADLDKRWSRGDDPAQWQVVRLELVGLLRFDEPRVYITASLPRMDELADVTHRSLNEFEKRALPLLASQQDIVVDLHPQRIQMLGAVRAGKNCLECHEGQRGQLLGAFSYEIAPLAKIAAASASGVNSAELAVSNHAATKIW